MAKKTKFADIDLDFTRNPVSGDINILTDEKAIKRSVRNLVLTTKYERLFQPEIQCRVNDRLFENITALTEVRIEQAIRNTIDNFEPRVEVIDVVVDTNANNNELFVTIAFRVRNVEEVQEVQVRLERTR
tara:strand:+ start:963 stop:1352 length:390 start_codon:yes stop_codon:yes gene_type:complete